MYRSVIISSGVLHNPETCVLVFSFLYSFRIHKLSFTLNPIILPILQRNVILLCIGKYIQRHTDIMSQTLANFAHDYRFLHQTST